MVIVSWKGQGPAGFESSVDGRNLPNHLGRMPKPCKHLDKLRTSTGAGCLPSRDRSDQGDHLDIALG